MWCCSVIADDLLHYFAEDAVGKAYVESDAVLRNQWILRTQLTIAPNFFSTLMS